MGLYDQLPHRTRCAKATDKAATCTCGLDRTLAKIAEINARSDAQARPVPDALAHRTLPPFERVAFGSECAHTALGCGPCDLHTGHAGPHRIHIPPGESWVEWFYFNDDGHETNELGELYLPDGYDHLRTAPYCDGCFHLVADCTCPDKTAPKR